MAQQLVIKRIRRGSCLVAFSLIPLVGCTSLSSPRTWFSRTASSPSTPTTTSLAESSSGFSAQLKSMGTTMTSAMGKAKDAVASTFTLKNGEAVDAETSLAHLPNSLGAEIWVTNGQVFEAKGNHLAALDQYTKALEREPNNVPALVSTARLYMRQEQYASAIDFYQRVITVSPTAEHYAELADAQQRSGRVAEAQASIQKAIALEPSVARYRNNLAGMLVAVGRSDEAVQQLEQVFPTAVANYNVAFLHFKNNNLAATQQHLQIALQADPNLEPARRLMATLTQSQTAQTATAAYQAADQVFRTAQGVMAPTLQASPVPYTTPAVPASGTRPGQTPMYADPANSGFPTVPAQF